MKKTEVIESNYGKIQGYIEKNIEIFKGISYAGSPVETLRFMAPEQMQDF